MEGKPDWLSGFPVQIYCNRSDLIYPPQPPRMGPSAYKADDLYQKMKKEEGRNQAPGKRAAIIRLLYAYEP